MTFNHIQPEWVESHLSTRPQWVKPALLLNMVQCNSVVKSVEPTNLSPNSAFGRSAARFKLPRTPAPSPHLSAPTTPPKVPSGTPPHHGPPAQVDQSTGVTMCTPNVLQCEHVAKSVGLTNLASLLADDCESSVTLPSSLKEELLATANILSLPAEAGEILVPNITDMSCQHQNPTQLCWAFVQPV